MAIPGAIMFSIVGVAGQFIADGLDHWRIQYIFDHEQSWKERGGIGPEKDDKMERFEEKFAFLEKMGFLRKKDDGERIAMLKKEISKLDGMLKKVDDEIEKLEKEADNSTQSQQ
jgi:predicted nuclease with TOPRIM domain